MHTAHREGWTKPSASTAYATAPARQERLGEGTRLAKAMKNIKHCANSGEPCAFQQYFVTVTEAKSGATLAGRRLSRGRRGLLELTVLSS